MLIENEGRHSKRLQSKTCSFMPFLCLFQERRALGRVESGNEQQWENLSDSEISNRTRRVPSNFT